MEQIDQKKQDSQLNQSLISTNHLFVVIEEKQIITLLKIKSQKNIIQEADGSQTKKSERVLTNVTTPISQDLLSGKDS